MRRILQQGAIVFALFMAFFVVGCTENGKTITGVDIDPTSHFDDVDITEFDLSDLKLIVTYSDGSEETITVTNQMISSGDLARLQYRGTHEISINYQDYTVDVTIVLEDQATDQILEAYYLYASTTLGFQGTFDAWILSVTNQGSLSIKKAEYNQGLEIILTLSNDQTLNLGQITTETVSVTFYDMYGAVIDIIIIPKGGMATPPIPPVVTDYMFMGWDGIYEGVITDVQIYAIYERIVLPVDIENADEVIISIDRLEHAQFEVDLDTIFSQTSNTMSRRESKTLSSILNAATQMDTDPLAPDNYIPHTYWNHMFYHKSLYEQPAIIDGYHVITETLTTYSDHALNNLYETTEQVTSYARDRADWAVDYITVVDTWVIDGTYKYLLHYDEVLDRVELYTIWTYAPLSLTSYEKIFVFYNTNGEEVIESWVYQIYADSSQPGYPGVMAYHNSVGGRDFNYYAVWLDESYEPTWMHHFRGINLNEEGYYEYYDNDSHMISGEYGWYTIQPYIYPNQQQIVYPETPNMTLYSPDASTNVVTIFKNFDSGYQVNLYLPAMNGVEALLVEEGGMYQENQDSVETQAMLTSYGFDIMPDWWVVNNDDPEIIKGFRTAKGTYYEQQGTLSGTVTLQYVNILIGSEGLRDYDYYYNRYGNLTLYIDVEEIGDLVTALTNYLFEVGLSYKYGDTAMLFEEMGYIYDHYEEMGKDIMVTNYTLWGPRAMYTDYQTYLDAVDYIYDNLAIREALMGMDQSFDEINMADMPAKTDLNSITFIHTEQAITGGLALVGTKLSTDQLTASLSRSPLLQNGKSYSLFYALMIGGHIIELAHTTPQVFNGQDLNFSSDFDLDMPNDLNVGEYQLVVFFAKITEDGFLRVSNATLAPVSAFDDVSQYVIDEENETSVETKVSYMSGSVVVNVSFTDAFSPKVYLKDGYPFATTDENYGDHGFQGDLDATLLVPMGSSVSDLIEAIYALDNVDGELELTVNHITKDNLPVLETDALTETGWLISVTDQAGNVTDLTLTISFGYIATFMVDDIIIDKIIVTPQDVITPIDAPIKEGYTFIGWGTDDFTMNEDRAFIAVYEPNVYTISWKYLEDIVGTTEVAYGEPLGEYSMPEVEGHYFFWDKGYEKMPAMDLVVEGNYYKMTYTIFYYLDGAPYQEVNVLFGETIDYLAVTVPDGYHFSGWDATHITMPAESFFTYGTLIPNE